MQIMQSNANHDVKNEIIYNREVLKCNLCDNTNVNPNNIFFTIFIYLPVVTLSTKDH